MADPEKQAIWGQGVWGEFKWNISFVEIQAPKTSPLIFDINDVTLSLGLGVVASTNDLQLTSNNPETKALSNLLLPHSEGVFTLGGVQTRSVNKVPVFSTGPTLFTTNEVGIDAQAVTGVFTSSLLLSINNDLEFKLGLGVIPTSSELFIFANSPDLIGASNTILPSEGINFTTHLIGVDTVAYDFEGQKNDTSRKRTVEVHIRNNFTNSRKAVVAK